METDLEFETRLMNIAIAIYDGWEYVPGKEVVCPHCHLQKMTSRFCICYQTRDRLEKGEELWYPKEIDYHKDWQLLMLLVEKIERQDYGFRMCRKRVEVYIDSTKEVIIDIKKSSRKESLFYALYQFIVVQRMPRLPDQPAELNSKMGQDYTAYMEARQARTVQQDKYNSGL